MGGMPSQHAFPPLAITWLTAGPGPRTLAWGRSCQPLMAGLAASGQALVVSDPTPEGVRALLRGAPRALPVVAAPASLPFASHVFDRIVLNSSLHRLDADAVLPAFARTLVPGGTLNVAYTVRDDSVPWVRRLVALLQAVDPTAMTGGYGHESIALLEASPCFHAPEKRTFRRWEPISRGGLLALVSRRFPDLEPDALDALLVEVAGLYDSSARRPEPLLLPYQVVCWRSEVDHAPLPAPRPQPDGLQITL